MYEEPQRPQKQQTVIRIDKNAGNYFVLHRSACNDRRLSIEALGLHTWMMSRPDDWEFTVAGMMASRKDSEHAIRKSLKELKEHGYVLHYRERDESGRLGKTVILVLETPNAEIPMQIKQSLEEPNQGNREQVSAVATKGLEPAGELPNQVIPNLEKPNLEKPNQENQEQACSVDTKGLEPNGELPNQAKPNLGNPNLDSPNLEIRAQLITESLLSTDLSVVEEKGPHDPFVLEESQKFDKLHDEIATRLGKSFLDALDVQCLISLLTAGIPGEEILKALDLVINTYQPKRNGDRVKTLRFADEQIRSFHEARLEIQRGKEQLSATGGERVGSNRTTPQERNTDRDASEDGSGYYGKVGTDL